MSPLELYIGYVHPGTVSHAFMDSLFRTLTVSSYHVTLGERESGPLIAEARNGLVQAFLQTDCEYLFFVDTDVAWEAWVPMRLSDTDCPIVSALYIGRNQDWSFFPIGFDTDMARLTPEGVKDAGLCRVGGVGMGCTLIRRDVLEALDTGPLWPFAETVIDGATNGEDVTFCVRARSLGFESYIDTETKVDHRKWGFI